VVAENVANLAVMEVPDSDCVVPAAGGEPGTVRGECQGVDVLTVAFENVTGFLGMRVPDSYGLVLTRGYQH
jgi:hypothetical protein